MRFVGLTNQVPEFASDEMKEAFNKVFDRWENQQRDDKLTYIKLLTMQEDKLGFVTLIFDNMRDCSIEDIFVDKNSGPLKRRIVSRMKQIFNKLSIVAKKEDEEFYGTLGFIFSGDNVVSNNGTLGIDRNDINYIVDEFIKEIKLEMQAGKTVNIRNFGALIVKYKPPKSARDMAAGKNIVIPEHYVPSFRPYSDFLNKVKSLPVLEAESIKEAEKRAKTKARQAKYKK